MKSKIYKAIYREAKQLSKKHLFLLSFLVLGLGVVAQTPRMVLYEEFTGETCPPCAATNPSLNIKLKADSALIVPIKWQVPIPSAPTKTWSLYQTNKTEIDWRWKSTGYGYNPAINSAPSSKIDGQEATVFGAQSSHPADLTHAAIVSAQSYTSAFSITMTRAWNKSTTAVNLTVTILATAPFTSSAALVFRTVMVERLIQFSVQPGSNGETKFEDVAIKSFPTLQVGTSLPGVWTVGQTQTFTLSCPLPAYTRKKDQVAIVGFIQDDGNKKVAQAVRANKAAISQTALSGVSANVNLTCTNLITPTVEVKNESSATAITALTLTPYIDGVVGSATTQWTGNLAPGASTIITLNQINSPSLSGSHTFSCDIDISAPNYNMISNNTKVTYMSGINYQGTPVVQGFSATAFPPQGFGAINLNNGPGWSRSNVTGGYNTSQESAKYDFFNNAVTGDQDELYLPPMDLSSAASAQLYYDFAYAQRTSNSDDALDIFVSDNCGLTWTNVLNRHGASLVTNPNLYNVAYVPDSQNPEAHWHKENIDLSTYHQSNLLIKFVTTSDNGNNLYLDNINLSFDVTGLNKYSASALKVNLYPNPANGTTQLSMSNMKAGAAKISVVNTLGQVIFVKEATLTEGTNTVQLDVRDYTVGIYNVVIDTQNGSTVKKLSVTK